VESLAYNKILKVSHCILILFKPGGFGTLGKGIVQLNKGLLLTGAQLSP
jgi:hypothetical protein